MTTDKPDAGLLSRRPAGLVQPDFGGWISGPCTPMGHLEVVPCEGGCVDVRDSRNPEELLHVKADEFAAFAVQIRAGAYDHLLP